MIGAVGDDEAGRELSAGLAAEGIDIGAVTILPGVQTGQAYIHVSAVGENMIVVAGGANLAIRPAEAVGPSVGVFLTQLETPIAAIEALLARSPGPAIKLLNAAPAVAGGEKLFPRFDILIVNETELARYAAAAEPTGLNEVAALARRLVSRPGQSVVVTLGAAGAAGVTAETAFLVPGRTARAVDTTGAGDCFCGVLAAALDQGAELAEAMGLANAAAALSTQTHGAGVSMPTREAAAAFAAG
jgi:ribokinase